MYEFCACGGVFGSPGSSRKEAEPALAVRAPNATARARAAAPTTPASSPHLTKATVRGESPSFESDGARTGWWRGVGEFRSLGAGGAPSHANGPFGHVRGTKRGVVGYGAECRLGNECGLPGWGPGRTLRAGG